MWANIYFKCVRISFSGLTLTALLNLTQKSLNIWKHSSNFIVSLSSQKKSMRAFPSFCNSRFWCSSSFRCLRANCSKTHMWHKPDRKIEVTTGHTYFRNLLNSYSNLRAVTEPTTVTDHFGVPWKLHTPYLPIFPATLTKHKWINSSSLLFPRNHVDNFMDIHHRIDSFLSSPYTTMKKVFTPER